MDLFIELGASLEQLEFPVIYASAINGTSSFDPDLSNNYDFAWVGLDASAAEEETTNTLPEAGNPLAMALLALLAIGIGGIKRRF